MVSEESVAFPLALKDNPLTVTVMNDACRVFMHFIEFVFMGIQVTHILLKKYKINIISYLFPHQHLMN